MCYVLLNDNNLSILCMYFVVNCERLFRETGSCDIKLGLAAKYLYFRLRI